MTEMKEKKKQKDQASLQGLGSESPRSESALGSPSDKKKDFPQKLATPSKKIVQGGAIVTVLVSIVSVSYYMLRFNPDPGMTWTNVNFNFPKYCPLADYNIDRLLPASDNSNGFYETRMLSEDQQRKLETIGEGDPPTYIVYVKVVNSSLDESVKQLAYCSAVVSNVSVECNQKNIFYACTSPGPVFYVEQNVEINVVWFNDITVQESQTLPNSSYHQDASNDDDKNANKEQKYVNESCTYFDPTANYDNASKAQFNWSVVPLSTHIHGLEVRPTFDGNPMSWFMRDSTKAIGYMSLNLNEDYYNNRDLFPNDTDYRFNVSRLAKDAPQVKVNSYPNVQSPGNLWYHDHAMRATAYNVANGLTGMYIIYNKQVQAYLNSIADQKMILVTGQNFDGKINIINSDQSTCYRERFSRFRLLNGNFGGSVSFSFGYDVEENGKSNTVLINTTVIGADSVLFDKFEQNYTTFQMGPAERVELLIDFQRIPNSVSNFRLIAGSNNITFQLKGQCCECNSNPKPCLNKLPTKMQNCSQKKTQLSYRSTAGDASCFTKFQNLTNVTQTKSKAEFMRFRVLDSTSRFSINGHNDFMEAVSENPKIGSTQDWFFINIMGIAHPLHVHLIQYQIQAKYQQKMFNEYCSFYKLDYYRVAFSGQPYNKMNNTQFCNFLRNGMTSLENLTQILNGYHLENEFSPNETVTEKDLVINESSMINVSGLYVYKLIGENETQQYRPKFQNQSKAQNCSESFKNYRYICFNNQMPKWQRRWKQVALVESLQIVRIRIRWASPEFNASDIKQGKVPAYFRLSEQSLAEYPGFVYHCHILRHEDSQMMRPIMLQFSDAYISGQKGNIKDKPKNWKQLLLNSKLNCANAKAPTVRSNQ